MSFELSYDYVEWSGPNLEIKLYSVDEEGLGSLTTTLWIPLKELKEKLDAIT